MTDGFIATEAMSDCNGADCAFGCSAGCLTGCLLTFGFGATLSALEGTFVGSGTAIILAAE